jgi:DNA ligase-1
VLLADVIAASAAVAATRSRTAKAGTIAELLRRAGADEVEPVTAWLAGELRQGALEGVVLDAVATAAGVPAAAVRRAFMLSGRLPETAAIALTGGVDALDAVCLEVGRPVRPMLASPGSSLDAALADLGTDVSVEFKLDGARIQVHRDGKIVRVWTRALREVTDGVPELVDRVRALPCDTVLDGENLALDDDGRPRAFQDTSGSMRSLTCWPPRCWTTPWRRVTRASSSRLWAPPTPPAGVERRGRRSTWAPGTPTVARRSW